MLVLARENNKNNILNHKTPIIFCLVFFLYLCLKFKTMAYAKEDIDNIFNYICTEIEKGRALRNVLKDDKMPSTSTFYEWLELYPEKSKQYTRATEIRAEAIFDDILSIADQNANDTYVNDNGFEVVNNDVIQRSRLRIEARKWVLSKLNPKKFGEKLDVTSDNKPISQPPIFGDNPLYAKQ